MLYSLFQLLHERFDLPGAGVFQYISFRAGAAIVGITAKNVSVRLYRIKEQLKQMSNQ